MTDVEFFFDPSCPWTWVTSRWLATVAPHRQLNVTWRTWSLGMKNEGQELPEHLPDEVKDRIRSEQVFTRMALRVIEAGADRAGNDAAGRLYTEMGRLVHAAKGHFSGEVVPRALAAAGLPADLAEAGDDELWDTRIRGNMADVAEQIGDDVGVPIVAIATDGTGYAMSGPIMTEVPPLERSLRLWDAVATVVTEPGVAELKRVRRSGPHPPVIDAAGRAE